MASSNPDFPHKKSGFTISKNIFEHFQEKDFNSPSKIERENLIFFIHLTNRFHHNLVHLEAPVFWLYQKGKYRPEDFDFLDAANIIFKLLYHDISRNKRGRCHESPDCKKTYF